MTTKHNITIPQGSTWRLVVTVLGGPSSLVGYVGSMQIRKAKADAVALATVATERFQVNSSTRQVVVELSDEDTGSMSWSSLAFYDLYLEGPTGDRWRIIEGVATLSKTVTREEEV